MATVNKNFKVKNGLVVEGTTATVNGKNILLETTSDQYILDLVGGVAYITSISGDFAVTGGELSIAAGSDLARSGDITDALFGYATEAYITGLLGDYTTTASLDTTVAGYGYLKNADLPTMYTDADAVDAVSAVLGEGIEYVDGSFDVQIGEGLEIGGGTGNEIVINRTTVDGWYEASGAVSTHNDLTTGVHGVTGDVVGTSGAQLLSNKSIDNNLGFQDPNIATNLGFVSALGNVLTVGTMETDIVIAAGSGSTSYIGSVSTDNEIATVGTSQDISNKRIIDTLYFSDGVTIAEEGEIAVRAVTHDFDVQANYGDLHLKTVHTDGTTGSDVQITSTYGDILLNAAGTAYYGSASAENEIATHGYVDNAISGLNWKQAVNLLYDAAIPVLSGSGATQLIVDGHDPLGDADSGYRLLLTGATSPGIYVYNSTGGSWTLTRAEDADVFGELIGAAVYVMEGTQYGSTSWVQGNHYLTDFTGQSWTQFSGQGSVTAGDGITVDGLEVSIDRTTVDDWYDAYGSAAAITPTSLGLGNVDNTSDLNKPISTATQTALDDKADAANPTLTGSLTLDGSGDFTITSDSNIVLDANTTSYIGSAATGNEIATEGYVDSAISNAAFDAAEAAGANLDWNGVTNQFDVNVSDVITSGDIATNTSVGTDITTAIDALTTDDIEEGPLPEGGNKYFTDARAKDSATDLLTGAVLTNIQIFTDLMGNLNIEAENGVADSTTDDLTEGSTNLYFTDQKALDAIDGQTITPLAVEINTYRKEEAAQQYVANASTVNIHSLPAGFESAKYLVRAVAVVNGTKHSQLTEILLTTDGMNNIAITEYGSICTDANNLASFSADMVGLPAQPTLTATTAVAGCEIIAAATMLSWAD